MAETVSPAQATARLEPADTLGIPLGPGQPPAFMAALGGRDDWTELRIYGALLLAWSEAYRHPNVHYLSGFFGPVERALRDQGANLSFVPADFRRFEPLLEQQAPRVMATVATPPDADGWCSLSLHAGGTGRELARAGADPKRLLVVEVSPRFPRTRGLPPEHRHAIHLDQIDLLVESEAEPFALPTPSRDRPTRRLPPMPGGSSPTARPCRPGSARSRRRSSAASPRARTAATTASTARCSPMG